MKVLGDGWTAVTKDGSLSAHFEHTVVVVNGGNRILTALPAPVTASERSEARRSSASAELEPGTASIRSGDATRGARL